MRFDRFIRDWKTLLAENFFLKSLSLLIGIGLILNATVFKTDKVVVITPPEVREEYWVGKNKASKDYIEQMAVFFAVLSGNLSPTSAAYNINALLKYVSPSIYADIKNSLMGDAMTVIENNMTTSFFPNDVKVEGSSAIVNGESIRRIGSARPVKEKVMYKMKFEVDNYKLFLTEFFIEYTDKSRREIFNKKRNLVDRKQIREKFNRIEKEMKKK
jgi:conjugal transfer pilus assembly protein TraE